MADELQKHLDGNVRSTIEGDLELWEIGINVESDKLELITEIVAGSTYLHFPSLERLDDITASDSGATLIGVEDDSFVSITGDTDLQTCLKSVDTALAALPALTDVILKDGSVNMEGAWTCEDDVYIDGNIGIGVSSVDSRLHVVDTNSDIIILQRNTTATGSNLAATIKTFRNETSGDISSFKSIGAVLFAAESDGVAGTDYAQIKVNGKTTTEEGQIVLRTNNGAGLQDYVIINEIGNVSMPSDSTKFIQGAGSDTEQYFDGTDYYIKKAVDSGNAGSVIIDNTDTNGGFLLQANSVTKISFTEDDGHIKLSDDVRLLDGGEIGTTTTSNSIILESDGDVLLSYGLGIGITPNAGWGAGTHPIQIETDGAIYKSTNPDSYVLAYNSYYDGSNEKYIGTGNATKISAEDGGFYVNLADGGTADNNITWEETLILTRSGMWLKGLDNADFLITIDGTTTNYEIQHFEDEGELRLGGDVSSGNYLAVEADGTWVANGNATTWEDINIDLSPLQSGGTKPGFVTPGTSSIRLLAFNINEEVDGTLEIPHSYKLGSDITPHIHWVNIGAPTGTDQVRWQLDYWIVDAGGTVTSDTSINTGDVAVDTDDERVDANFSTFSHATLGGQIGFKISRIAAAGDAFAGECGVLTFGFHYEKDMNGSRQITTK